MFDYFRNYSSDHHQVCSEHSPSKGLFFAYEHFQSNDLGLNSRSQVRLKLDYFLLCNYLGWYLSNYIQTGLDGRPKHGIYAHARLDDLDLDARSKWVGPAKIQWWNISTTKQTISIKLATTVGHFLRHFDFANVYNSGLTLLLFFH